MGIVGAPGMRRGWPAPWLNAAIVPVSNIAPKITPAVTFTMGFCFGAVRRAEGDRVDMRFVLKVVCSAGQFYLTVG